MQITRFTTIILAGISLTACDGVLPQSEEALFADEVHNAVTAQLRDPESARFTAERFYPKQRVACGFINAKNGFGGYGDKQVYEFAMGRVTIEDTIVQSDIPITNFCTKADREKTIEELETTLRQLRSQPETEDSRKSIIELEGHLKTLRAS